MAQFRQNKSTPKQIREFKIIIIGEPYVGKTCLSYRFCEGKFLPNPEATIGVDFRERTVDVDGEKIKLRLWDTAGQERFRQAMVHHYYRNVDGVVIVFDVTKMSTFESLPEWIEECKYHSVGSDIPRVLVGNKCDCKEKQVVKRSEALRFSDIHNMPYFETSAQDESESDNVEAIFLTLALKLKNHRPLMLSPLSEVQGSNSVEASHQGFILFPSPQPKPPADTSCC
ncbi:ras-related protein Rab-33B-like isoform X1 [Zootermopsis nevadensis]|uniref:Ras-related protein Rab-33B n=1 Tax=Zootermopsis nevadensis TaxID=136037 RepID=A0A067QV14_ZOONE|nr:ras-related protein Rab-33B-like isoform X1 [Zootermopsis nevadensis]KDR13853.1 Ras-related protein Rab-33B [Zootermopsis nevadensis]